MDAIKWVMIVGVVATILGGIGWTVDQLMDVSTLRANNAALTQANADNLEQLNFFRNDANKKQQQITAQQADYAALSHKYTGLRQEIKDVTKQLSEADALCAGAAVPVPYVDIMRRRHKAGAGGGEAPSNPHVPGTGAVSAAGG